MKNVFCHVGKRLACFSLAALLALSPLPISAAGYTKNSLADEAMVEGNIVTFGTYEQDNNPRNGAEPIEWIVLDYDSTTDCSLLISRYILDIACFETSDAEGDSITWANSELRTWLNDDFLDYAFSDDEQEALCKTKIITKDFIGRAGGKNTEDYVFLLSRQEAKDYFDTDKERRTTLTDYALDQAEERDTKVTRSSTWWFLRSPGGYDFDVSVVDESGKVTYGRKANGNYGVRPAMWIDLGEV